MYAKERWKGALALSLIWVVVAGITLYFIRDSHPAILWTSLYISLLLMAVGLAVYLGGVKPDSRLMQNIRRDGIVVYSRTTREGPGLHWANS